MNKYMQAIARHERARQTVDKLTREIGIEVGKCPIDIEARLSPYGDLWTQDHLHTKTHLWQAFQHREPSSCGWGGVPLCEDGMLDSLSEGSSYECAHCLAAYQLILHRKEARQELGRSRLAIRALGRQAIKEIGDD